MTATYLYCIVQAARKPPVTGAPEGLPGAKRPEAIAVTPSLWAIVAEVPLDIYGGEKFERALADLDWVGRVAVAHEALVEYFSGDRTLTVIPLKLFTMFSSPDRAMRDLRARKASIARAMKTLAGAEEWGVRVLRTDRSAPAAAARETPVTSGTAFLAARKAARDTARNARVATVDAANQAFDRLSRIARDAHLRTDVPAGAASVPLLNAAFLVPREKRAAFEKAAKREAEACARAGAELTVTGPWPAYNFVTSD